MRVSFTTADDGAPVADPQALAGQAWRLDLTEGVGLAVETAPTLVGTRLGVAEPTLEVVALDPATDAIRLALHLPGPAADASESETCPSSTARLSGTLSNPAFDAASGPVDLPTVEGPVRLEAVRLRGLWRADGSVPTALTWQATVDSRALSAFFEEDLPEDVCFVDLAGLTCEPCADGVPVCFTLDIAHIPAFPVDMSPETDPACADTDPGDTDG